ncbi:Clavaminate synthase-like protein [Coniophora puteana RWD-64-598 SS2]|uniref:Clavaminate synthase-like protein n=1 Tax=Coniophora puteana (strain RWD-64-598) TaxID=741705 RepID=A0A5M3MQG1_CONPW|nr:Clavaminate synthase-like protein [Coniophora puteana RWD-64-598 SS2]EIW80964.1 Clavaminate synthase-like protein [Coniophora puteana RWD-64-598 SS2]
MSNREAAGLPIIDIGPYLDPAADESARQDVSSALHAACLKYGFFYLDISKFVDKSEPEDLTQLARKFFALPQEDKDKISIKHQDFARGYQRLQENVTGGKADNHEGIDFYKPVELPDKSKPLWGENQWPDVPGFKEKYDAWVAKMKNLGMIVMEAMAIGLGMAKDEWEALKHEVDDSFWVMRIIGYPPLPNDYDGFSCGAHKDYGCLTFLYADPTKSALQVFVKQPGARPSQTNGLPTENGAEDGVWIDADPIPGCVVCNIGEMWEIWTQGLYKSTLHRVVHRGSNYRIPFFFEPNFSANVTPLPAALRIIEKNRSLETKEYAPVKYGDFLLRKVTNNFAVDGKGRYD